MEELAGRLAPLDPDASAALRVISYFDELLARRGGLETMVRGAAVLTGASARLLAPGWRMAMRVLPDGRRVDSDSEPDESWQKAGLADEAIVLWLERPAPPGPVELMVLERAVAAIRVVLERTPGRIRSVLPEDPTLVEVVVDPEAPLVARERAARRLGLRPGQLIRVVVATGTPLRIEPVVGGSATASTPSVPAGVGHPVPVEEAPASAHAARLALRLVGAASCADLTMRAEELGVLLLLVETVGQNERIWQQHPDLQTIGRTHARLPWSAQTLRALSTTDSLRAASAVLVIHHSTMQARLKQLRKALGWDVASPQGKLRLQLALVAFWLVDDPTPGSGITDLGSASSDPPCSSRVTTVPRSLSSPVR